MAFFAFVILASAACGGADSELTKAVVSALEGGTLSSASGELTLSFPPGAVPDGTADAEAPEAERPDRILEKAIEILSEQTEHKAAA